MSVSSGRTGRGSLAIHLPALLLGVSRGATMPTVPVTSMELGATAAGAAIIMSALGVGAVVSAVPAAALIDRITERWAMVAASVLGAVAMVVAMGTANLALFVASVVALGLAGPVLTVARQSHLAATVPADRRGKAMSALAGMVRTGHLVGPFVGAAVLHVHGPRGSYLVAAVAFAASAIVVWGAGSSLGGARTPRRTRQHRSVLAVVRGHPRTLVTLGAVVVAVMAARGARPVVIPLWAAHLGLDASTGSLLYGLSGAVELLMFYPAGAAMDRWGRKVVAVPSLIVMAAGLFTTTLSHDVLGLGLAGAVLGLGNGLTAGLVMTLGVDMAPVTGRVTFLGLVRVLAESGSAAGLAVLAVTTGLGGLAVGLWAVTATSLIAGALISRYVPAYRGGSG